MPALDFNAFLRSVSKHEVLPAYYFHGDVDLLKDDGLRDLLKEALDPATRDFNLDRRRAAELATEDFATLAQTPPMMARRRALVITEVEDLQQRREKMQKLRAAIVDYLSQPSDELLLVLVQSAGAKPDADLARRAASVAFEPFTTERLIRWIRHRAETEQLEMDEDAVTHLHEVVGDDLPQLAAELAKLKGAVQGRPATADDVSALVGVRRGETMYALVEAVTSRDVARAAGMVRSLLDTPGITGVRLVMALGTALAGVAFARALLDAGRTPGSAENELKSLMFSSRPWNVRGYADEARRWSRDAAKWTLPSLERALTELLRADRRLKATSIGGEADILLEALLGMADAQVAA